MATSKPAEAAGVSEPSLLFSQRGPAAWLTLNRPDALNAIDLDMIAGYGEHLPRIAVDDSIRVLVITGTGRAFCAGADLTQVLDSLDVEPGEPDFLDRLGADVFGPLRDLDKPVIAALNGTTLAGGLETAMCADIVIAAEGARIGDGHANYGVFPGGGGAAILPRIVPHHVAKYLLLTGRTLTAEQMRTYGFVSEVVPGDALVDAAQSLAEELASKSPLVLRRMKEVADASLDKSRDDALVHELHELRRHLRSWDIGEGLAAFTEKRTPGFRGC